jgi:hypothetical protein
VKRLLVTTLALSGFLVACLGFRSTVFAQEGLRIDKGAVAEAIGVQERHNPNLLSIAGVVGTGVGLSQETNEVVIEVYVEKRTPDLEGLLPRVLEGIPVKMVVTGKIYAY